MDPEALTRMRRMIRPVGMRVESIDGTWKLNQNKEDAARLSAAERITGGMGSGLDEIARLMRGQSS